MCTRFLPGRHLDSETSLSLSSMAYCLCQCGKSYYRHNLAHTLFLSDTRAQHEWQAHSLSVPHPLVTREQLVLFVLSLYITWPICHQNDNRFFAYQCWNYPLPWPQSLESKPKLPRIFSILRTKSPFDIGTDIAFCDTPGFWKQKFLRQQLPVCLWSTALRWNSSPSLHNLISLVGLSP